MLSACDCRHVCIWCEYYEQCKQERGQEDESTEHEKK